MLDALPRVSATEEGPDVAAGARRVYASVRARAGARRIDVLHVPGRIEVLGKHSDYAGGRSLTCATPQGVCLAVAARDDDDLVIDDLTLGVEIRVGPEGGDGATASDAGRIPAVVQRRVRADFGTRVRGADIAVARDLPAAAGMSSSSALGTGLFLALAAASGIAVDDLRRLANKPRDDALELLAGYLAAVEAGRPFGGGGDDAEGVGTRGGSEDHVAILLSRGGRLGLYRYDPLVRLDSVVMPVGWTFAVAVSGVHASKATSEREAYNRLSRLTEEAAALWRRRSGRDDPHLGAAIAAAGARAVRAALVEGAGAGDPPRELVDRFDAFERESEVLVPRAAAALAEGDLAAFGREVARSQRLAESRLGNQVRETSFLAASAVGLGAAAASAFGAGFGGAVWALVRENALDDFHDEWRRSYRGAFPRRAAEASFLACPPAPPARRIGVHG